MEKDTKDTRRVQKNRRLGRKCSGIITCDLGDPQGPMLQAVEAYCIHNQKTISEAVRGMITVFLKEHTVDEVPKP